MLASIAGSCGIIIVSKIHGASAVAVAINPDGSLRYGFSHDPGITEVEAKNRAIQECLIAHSWNPRIITSTSRRGYGAIVMFDNGDKKFKFTASLGAASPEQAVSSALAKAKGAGGLYFKVVTSWNDVVPPKGGRPPGMIKL